MTQFDALSTRLPTRGMDDSLLPTCLYSPTAEFHRPLAGNVSRPAEGRKPSSDDVA